MLDFKRVEYADVLKYEKYYRGEGVCTCERTVTCKLLWDDPVSYAAETNGCLVFMSEEKERGTYFDYPMKGENGDVNAALTEIERYCLDKGLRISYGNVQKENLPSLAARYNYFRVENNRKYSDYVYRGEDMRLFEGKKYNGQRNHINHFTEHY